MTNDLIQEAFRIWAREDMFKLGLWADEHLPNILHRLKEADYKLGAIERAIETWDMPEEWEDGLREILGLPMPGRD